LEKKEVARAANRNLARLPEVQGGGEEKIVELGHHAETRRKKIPLKKIGPVEVGTGKILRGTGAVPGLVGRKI